MQAKVAAAPAAPAVTNGPLRINPDNGRFFVDASGSIVLLTGSHTWLNLQDSGKGFPPPSFDYTQYLNFLQANNHNFFRLWVWEQARWTVEIADDDYWFNPQGPFQRTGPGVALDGKAKFDLSKFDQSYFDRIRTRVIAARDRGIYVSVMLFNGWSVNKEKSTLTLNNPWKAHPFNTANNINGINGDRNNDNSGEESHELGYAALLAFQEAYVRKVIDTVNDLDNVLYEISNESHPASMDWQEHMVNFVHEYEATKAMKHPVGLTKPSPEGDTTRLLSGPADWISPDGSPTDPHVSSGAKVILYDTDHICGMCYGQTSGPNDLTFGHNFVWKSFIYGYNPIYMDGYDGAGYGVGGNGYNFNDPRWVTIRNNMGYALDYSRRMNFAAMKPRPNLSNLAWVLANTSATGAEYLAYMPGGGSFTLDLRSAQTQLAVEWLNPATGAKLNGGTVSGGAVRSFSAPFAGDAVLYVRDANGVVITPQPTATPSATQTATHTPTSTPLATATSTATASPTATATQTATYTPSPAPSATALTTATSATTPTATPTPATPPPPPTATQVTGATATATQPPGDGATPTPTATPSPTNTANPATATATLIPGKSAITIVVDAQPDSTQDFRFFSTLGTFLLDDAGAGEQGEGDSVVKSAAFQLDYLGQFFFQQQAVAGWKTTSILCTPDNLAIASIAQGSLELTIATAQQVVCTFVIEQLNPATPTPLPTAESLCVFFPSTDTPIEISRGRRQNSSALRIENAPSVKDVNVGLSLQHSYVGDLQLRLTHLESGKSALLLDRPGVPQSSFGCKYDDAVAIFSDEASRNTEDRCDPLTPTLNGSYLPQTPLSVFDGISGNGTWQLSIEDFDPEVDEGVVSEWSVQICKDTTATDLPLPDNADSLVTGRTNFEATDKEIAAPKSYIFLPVITR